MQEKTERAGSFTIGLSTIVSLRVETDRGDLLADPKNFLNHAKNVIREYGFTALNSLVETSFDGGGHSGAIILAESHLAWHSWPELNFVTIDLHICDYSRNNNRICREAAAEIVVFFQPRRVTGVISRWLPSGNINVKTVAGIEELIKHGH